MVLQCQAPSRYDNFFIFPFPFLFSFHLNPFLFWGDFRLWIPSLEIYVIANIAKSAPQKIANVQRVDVSTLKGQCNSTWVWPNISSQLIIQSQKLLNVWRAKPPVTQITLLIPSCVSFENLIHIPREFWHQPRETHQVLAELSE